MRVVKGFGAEAGAGRAACADEADDLYDVSMRAAARAGPVPAGHGAAAQRRADRRARPRRPPGADGPAHHSASWSPSTPTSSCWCGRCGCSGMIIAQAQRAAASAERVHEVLATDPEVADPPDPVRCPRRAGGRGRASRASAFGYGGGAPRVLDDLDLHVPAGRVGGPGRAPPAAASPRSPSCCCRFYDVEAGRIALDGVDVRDAAARRAAARGGHRVRGDVPLLATPSPPTSPSPGPTPTPRTIERAARLAGADEFIERPARGLRHRRGRAGLLALRRPAPAARHRPGHPGRPARADPRRRHLGGRPHQGARDPRRPGRGHARTARPWSSPTGRPPSPWPSGWCCWPTGGSRPTAPTTSCCATSAAYRQVLASARREEPAARRRRASATVGAHDARGRRSTAEDLLDRREAPARCCAARRACCGPTGARSSWSACLVVAWTAVDPGRALPRPLRHRRRDPRRRRRGPQPGRRRLRGGGGRRPTSSTATRCWSSAEAGEGFLRDLRIRVFDHLQRLSMPFYDREKAGVLVSRMTSDVDSLQELVQIGPAPAALNVLLLVLSLSSCWSCSLAAARWSCLIAAAAGAASPACKFQRDSNEAYLDRARPHRPAPSRTSRRASAGVRVIQAYGREGRRDRPLRRSQPDASTGAHMRSVLRPGLVPAGHRDRRPRHHRPGRAASAATWCSTARRRSAPSPSSC